MAILRLIIIITITITVALSFTTTVSSHNITDILSKFPQYSEFNKYLTATKLDDEINHRQTVTVLVFNNSIVTEFLADQPLAVVKIALSIHVLLDYFDNPKLLKINGGSVMTTTLYQTTGKATGNTGFVNITDLVGGKVGFGSGGSGSRLDALYERSVRQIPYNISVVEISAPIIAEGVLKASPPSNVNISGLLEKEGCKTFAKLISETGVLKVYLTAERRGLTVFAPVDGAFNASGSPDLSKLSDSEVISLLLYHAISGYLPKVSLMTEKNPVRTLASNEISEFGLTVRTKGDSVTLDSGVDYSRVQSTIIDSVPLIVFKIDHVLLPPGYFTRSPSPAAVPVPEASPPSPQAPASVPSTPRAHTPIASSPAPVARTSPAVVSPPAPPTPASSPTPSSSSTSSPAPADNPTGNGSSRGGIKAPVMFLALITVLVSGMI